MAVKLRVTNERADNDTPSEYLFEKDRITIGRGIENDLTLNDPKRIVSKEHAEIRREGNTYQLVDRESKNFTYYQNQRLQAGKSYDLAEGDIFHIGEYNVEFRAFDVKDDTAPEDEETVFAADFTNPFADPADQLTEALEEIIDTYEQEAPQRREDALKHAFRATGKKKLVTHDAVHRVLKILGADPSEFTTSQSPTPSHPSSATNQRNQIERSSKSRSYSYENTSQDSETSAPVIQISDEVADRVIDKLLESVSRVIEIPWQFRHEFIGQTKMQSSETEFIYDGDASTLKSHLMDPSISKEKRQKRMDYVQGAVEDLATHQMSMLNGYKASVKKGTEELMKRIDPDKIQSSVIEENFIYKYIPILATPAVLSHLRAQWHELQKGNWSAAEQRIFRPAFIKAYLARMTSMEFSSKA